MEWEGLWCPCCGYRLRGKPRNILYKKKLQSTDFRAGQIVRIYKDWKNCKNFEYRAILVKLVIPIYQTVGAIWLVRNYKEFKKNPECETEERIINIENKDKTLIV